MINCNTFNYNRGKYDNSSLASQASSPCGEYILLHIFH